MIFAFLKLMNVFMDRERVESSSVSCAASALKRWNPTSDARGPCKPSQNAPKTPKIIGTM